MIESNQKNTDPQHEVLKVNPSEQNADIIIIGAGISGLSAAWFAAAQGLQVLVLESSHRLGGCLNTVSHEDSWIENGAHTCYNSYASLIDILTQMPNALELQTRERLSFLVNDGQNLVKVTKSLNWLELFTHLPHLFWLSKAKKSVSDYYSKCLGGKNFKKLFKAAFSAVSCQDATYIPADFLFKKRPKNKNYPRSFTFKGGVSDLCKQLAIHNNIQISLNTSVHAIAKNENCYDLTTSLGQMHAEKLIVATPAGVATKLLAEVAPEVSKALDLVSSVAVNSLSFWVPQNKCATPKLAGVIPLKHKFRSIVSGDVVPHDRFRGFTVHASELESESRELVFSEESQSELLALACDALGITSDEVVAQVLDSHRLPSIDVTAQQALKDIKNLLPHGSLGLTGNYFSGMSIEDCIARSRTEITRVL